MRALVMIRICQIDHLTGKNFQTELRTTFGHWRSWIL